jgi:hypothetical protein
MITSPKSFKNALMSAVMTVSIVAISSSASGAAQPAKLRYLSTFDQSAMANFECWDLTRSLQVTMKSDGYDVFAGVPEIFKKAGSASVIKAALLAEEMQAKPQLPKLRFTSKKAESVIRADINAHAEEASLSLRNGSFDSGLETLSSCLSPERMAIAQELGVWLDEDVSLFETLK